MHKHLYKTHHNIIQWDGLNIFYRHAGDINKPAMLLLHGFPSSSHMFRKVIEPLAEIAYVVAPDLPGFGFSSAPDQNDYDYSFKNLANTIEDFISSIGLENYYLFLNDFGTPVGYHIAMGKPEQVLGLIIQNGNAHDEGLGPQWDDAKTFWSDPTDENRAKIPEWLNFEGTRDQYIGGLPEHLQQLYPPDSWHLDWERMSRPGNTDIQFQIFQDYQSHVERFPAIADYHHEHQPPTLVLWGRHDTFFDLEEIVAFSRNLDTLEIHVFESGHFLLETHHLESAELVRRFVSNVEHGVLQQSIR